MVQVKKRRKKSYLDRYLYLIIAGIVLLIVILAIALLSSGDDEMPSVSFSKYYDSDGYNDSVRIAKGVFIGGVDVGGMKKGDASELLRTQYSTPENQSVTVMWEDKQMDTNLSSLGVSWGVNKAINSAITLAHGGGIMQQYKTGKDLADGTFHIELAKGLDKDLVADFVNSMAKSFDVLPVDASIKRIDGGFDVTPGVNGRMTAINTTVGRIMEAFNELIPGRAMTVEASITSVAPAITADDLRFIETSLGAFSTIYRDEDNERTDRCINVEVGTSNINGTILMPGMTASTSDLLKERIAENGYAMGGQYVDGQLEDAIGGGVCQVASTLYNALLRAEIQIDKRSNHSLLVSYVEPSYDAAIATGSKDLVFTNNLDYPIYIYGATDGYKVTFRIYGKEYRPENRRVEYVNVVEKRIESVPIIKEDPTLFVNEEKKVGTTHDECWAHLEKVIYENDVEVSRTVMHSDYYQPSVATIYKGTIPVPSSEAEPTEPTSESPVLPDPPEDD